MTVDLKLEDSSPRPDLGGRSVTMDAVLADGDSRKVRFKLAEQIGSGGSANVYRVEPPNWSAKTWAAFGLNRGTPLVCKCEFEQSDLLRRRQLTLRALEDARAKSPDDLLGLVPLLAAGRREQRDPSSKIYLELMPHAGETLNAAMKSDDWDFTPVQILEAFKPVVAAMAAVHRLRPLNDPHGEVTGHRDIKPSNTFVLLPEDPGFAEAVEGCGEQAAPSDGLPLIRVGDLGNLYTKSLDREATETARAMRSRYWTAPEVLMLQSAAANVVARDVWSLAATIFFALTGLHPWQAVQGWIEDRQRIDDFQVATAIKKMPDSPGFASLEATEHGRAIVSLIKSCLSPAPEARPGMRDVMHDINQLLKASAPARTQPVERHESDQISRPLPIQKRLVDKHTNIRTLLIILAALVALAVCLVIWLRPSTTPPDASATTQEASSQPSSTVTPAPEETPAIGRGGWGPPDRTTYTWDHPADHAVLNSITNRFPEKALTDERYLLWVIDSEGKNPRFAVDVSTNDELSFIGIAANDAADNIRASQSLISNLTARLAVEGKGSQLGVYVVLDATTPGEPNDHSTVWSGVSVSSPMPIRFEYVADSFRVESSSAKWSENGEAFARGEPVRLGLKGPDGILPVGAGDDVLYFFFKLKVIAG
ncbi:protein kinase domain-containing protein [Paenarthrobacter nicotinovorans]|uniref:protein kinase domain-containing protein n=1 Tax=Paenarthrobacter nicotinovorans TaxID=29320 RepID=UPI003DA22B0D